MAEPTEVVHALSVQGCSKTYPSVRALTDVSLVVAPGEVRGLVGQNGAGKSTLIKIVAGAVQADSGTVRLGGVEPRRGVIAHREAGVSVIYQDPQTVPDLSAMENVFLGDLPRSGGWVRSAAMRQGFLELCAQLQVSIDPDRRASALSLGDRQLVEIMRAVRTARTLLILDEPTSALPEHERDRLFEVVRRIKASGLGVVFISHDLDEVLELCDSVSVLRDGRHVETGNTAEYDVDRLVTAMTGEARHVSVERAATVAGEVVLEVVDLVTNALSGVTLQVRAGEVVGLAGLLGSGRTETLLALAGADRIRAGAVSVDGREVRRATGIAAAKQRGLHLVPEDRRGLGLIPDLSVTENVSLGQYDARPLLGWVADRQETARQRPLLETVHLDPERHGSPVRTLSGGNQQKVLLARLLQHDPRVILLDEPTAGIDVKASAQILELVRQLADRGAAVLVVLSDLQELLAHTDRVYVMKDGRTVAELESAATSEHHILQLAFAQKETATA